MEKRKYIERNEATKFQMQGTKMSYKKERRNTLTDRKQERKREKNEENFQQKE